MKRQLSFAVVVFSLLVGSVARGVMYWDPMSGGNGHYYELVSPPGGVTWHEARDAATAHGGYLLTITSAAENQFVVDTFLQPNFDPANPYGFRLWLGATDIPSGWRWVTDEPFSFINWGLGQPSGGEGYLEYVYEPITPPIGWLWNDIPATGWGSLSYYSYVVETEESIMPIPEPSSLAALTGLGLMAGFVGWRRRRKK